uniref:Phosphoribosyl pyrophosphate amidotransferase n=1 Tax=Nomascus leucogenys TaxID=61853 RepID=A0A2I3HKN6_NOMLE
MELEELGIREECGVFGCIASGEWPTQLDVPHVITLGLVGLQHRGQESAGIVTSDGSSVPTFKSHKGMGLVNHVFTEDNLKKLYVSNLGIGHTRYATTGKCELENCQPFVVETLHGKIAVAHNGELVNAARLRKKISYCLQPWSSVISIYILLVQESPTPVLGTGTSLWLVRNQATQEVSASASWYWSVHKF